MAFFNARRYDEAAEQLSRTVALEPAFFQARFDLALVRELQGKHDESIAEYLQAIRLSGESAKNETALREAHNKSGWKGFWQKRLEQLEEAERCEYVSPFRFVEVSLRIGDTEAVFASLEKAYRERSPEMVYLAVNPLFDALRGNARFQDFAQTNAACLIERNYPAIFLLKWIIKGKNGYFLGRIDTRFA